MYSIQEGSRVDSDSQDSYGCPVDQLLKGASSAPKRDDVLETDGKLVCMVYVCAHARVNECTGTGIWKAQTQGPGRRQGARIRKELSQKIHL